MLLLIYSGIAFNILNYAWIIAEDFSQTTFKNDHIMLGLHALFKDIGIMIPTGILLTDNEIIAIAKDSHIGCIFWWVLNKWTILF